MTGPKTWPEVGEDHCNDMPATALHRGDRIPLCGKGEVPGKAEVVTVRSEQSTDYMLVTCKIPKTHVFDYVDWEPPRPRTSGTMGA